MRVTSATANGQRGTSAIRERTISHAPLAETRRNAISNAFVMKRRPVEAEPRTVEVELVVVDAIAVGLQRFAVEAEAIVTGPFDRRRDRAVHAQALAPRDARQPRESHPVPTIPLPPLLE